MCVIDRAPHDWLMQQVSAIVHHGGAGTTAAGLRAGKPTLIVPHMADQPFWGRRVHESGAGPEPILKPVLTRESLAFRLKELVETPSYAERASELGACIRDEDGVANGIAALERFAAALRGQVESGKYDGLEARFCESGRAYCVPTRRVRRGRSG
ncbi:MAG: glycosyltransferase family 1 protein [Chloroflexi bacterium]|nr:glycosyltransferase family 1 protein [Chloroflexota bacterium]